MYLRITIDLAGGGLKHPGTRATSKAEHIERTNYAGLGGIDGVVLIMDGRGWASQVIYLVNLSPQRINNVVAQELEVLVIQQVQYIIFCAGKKIIDT
jgi:hypothetical protein